MKDRGWHSRDSECGLGTFAIGAANTYGVGHEMVAQEVSCLHTNILLIK